MRGGVAVGVFVIVGVFVTVGVGVAVGVRVGVFVGPVVKVAVGVCVLVIVGVAVGVDVGVAVGVRVGVIVGVWVAVGTGGAYPPMQYSLRVLEQAVKVPAIQRLEVICVVPRVPLPAVDVQLLQVSVVARPAAVLPVKAKPSTRAPVSSFRTPLVRAIF